jgi:GMP reductase
VAEALAKDKILSSLHKYYSSEELSVFFKEYAEWKSLVFPSIGMKDEELKRLENAKISPNIVIDVPNGHIEKFVKFCAKVRSSFPSSIIMAGNVVCPSMVQELIIHGGVDIVKIFIGPGKFCRTRMVTGVGYPSFSATVECAMAAHGLKNGEKKLGLICPDGGFKASGDIAKAFGAGADFVMTGSMFGGCDECEGDWKLMGGEKWIFSQEFKEGEIVKYEGHYHDQQSKYPLIATPNTLLDKQWKIPPRKLVLKMYGMSSHEAQEIHGEGKKEYRASEGVVEEVRWKGPIKDTVQEILGGLRSTGTYIGAHSIKDFHKCAKFVRVNRIH